MAICAQRKFTLRAKKKKKSGPRHHLHTFPFYTQPNQLWKISVPDLVGLLHSDITALRRRGKKNNNIKLTNWYSSCWKRPQIDFIRRGRLPDDDHRLEVLFFHYMIRGGRYRSTTLLLLLLSHLLPPGRNVSIQSNLNSDIVGLLMIIILHINSLDALIFCSGFLELVCAIKPACNHARNDKH